MTLAGLGGLFLAEKRVFPLSLDNENTSVAYNLPEMILSPHLAHHVLRSP
jgi:hypothetical protein